MDSKPEDQTEKKDWAEMSDDEAENETAEAAEETQSKPEPEPKKIIPITNKLWTFQRHLWLKVLASLQVEDQVLWKLAIEAHVKLRENPWDSI